MQEKYILIQSIMTQQALKKEKLYNTGKQVKRFIVELLHKNKRIQSKLGTAHGVRTIGFQLGRLTDKTVRQ